MLCPNCGNDNPAGRAACAVCGRELTRPRGRTDEPAEPEIDLLWPQETVFVLEEEAEVLLELPAPPAQFEDSQADDVFEQSLSGVKLEDLIDEEERAFTETEHPEPSAEPPTAEPAPPAEPAAAPAEPNPGSWVQPDEPQTALHETRTVEQHIPAPLIEPIGSESPGTRRGRVLPVLVSLLVVFCAFAGGAAAGFWYAVENLPPAHVQPEVPPPSETTAAPQPVVPEGMVFIPGGDFLMGSDDAEQLSRPAHFVSLRSYFIDRTEVTNEQYRAFVEATAYDPPSTWKDGLFPSGHEKFPVTGVTWYDAAAFAAWAGKRLPTEAEWEFAARGTDGRRYPWGDEWDTSFANVGDPEGSIRPVGEGRPTPLGVLDMAGNAWEWTASDARPYPGGKEFPWSRLRMKIIRGGNFKSSAESSAATFRGYYGASGEKDYSSTSFRCVKDIQDRPASR